MNILRWTEHDWIWTGVTKTWKQKVDTKKSCFDCFFLFYFFSGSDFCTLPFVFFSSCRAFRHVSSYRGENYIELINEGIKNYFELAGGLSYRVRVTKGKITVNVWGKSRGNRLGSNWRGFELSGVNCMFIVPCVFLLKPILDPIITLHNKVK